jgi:hypothetical protein
MPTEVTLTETYHDLPFLAKLAKPGSHSSIVPAYSRTATTLLKRLKGNNISTKNTRAKGLQGRQQLSGSEFVSLLPAQLAIRVLPDHAKQLTKGSMRRENCTTQRE